jgi:hypothetical protein
VRALHAALFALLAGGCMVEEHHGHYVPGSSSGPAPPVCPTSSGRTSAVQVDADANPPTAAPGDRVGLFVEYAAGGHWHLAAICDTLRTGEGCTYDIWAQVLSGPVSNVTGEGLGPNDLAGTVGTDTARLSVDTSTETDGIRFDAPAGATVRLTMLLGQQSCVGLIYWKQAGAVRNDTNGNPVDLVPTSP